MVPYGHINIQHVHGHDGGSILRRVRTMYIQYDPTGEILSDARFEAAQGLQTATTVPWIKNFRLYKLNTLRSKITAVPVSPRLASTKDSFPCHCDDHILVLTI